MGKRTSHDRRGVVLSTLRGEVRRLRLVAALLLVPMVQAIAAAPATPAGQYRVNP